MKLFAMTACGLLLAASPVAAQPVNDLLVDFGSGGLWVRLNNSIWRKLDDQSPVAVTGRCSGSSLGQQSSGVVASFEGRGLLVRYVEVAEDWNVVRPEVPHILASANVDNNDLCEILAVTDRGLLVGFAGGWINNWRQKEIRGIAVGDFDDNPNDDIVGRPTLAPGERSIHVGFNNHPLSSAPYGQVGSGDAVATGDVDGNGLDDLVFAFAGDPISVLYTPIRFGPKREIIGDGLAAPLLAVGDLDADPVDDVLFTNDDGTWALLNGATPSVKLNSRRASHLAIADLDSNGRGDAVASFARQGVWVRLGSAFQLLRAGSVEALVPCTCDN